MGVESEEAFRVETLSSEFGIRRKIVVDYRRTIGDEEEKYLMMIIVMFHE